MNVNFKRDFEFELKKVKEKYANKFRDLEIQKIKETRELNVQIQDLKIELARASELNARYRQKLISTQSEVKELKQIIANLESDKQRNTPGFLTDGKQLAKLKKMLQQTELDYEFKLRELEQKNELIDTLTRQLFDLQKANPS